MSERLKLQLAGLPLTRTNPQHNPVRTLTLSEFPLPTTLHAITNIASVTPKPASVAVTFRDHAGRAGGIIAADFHATNRLGLFIANDTTPNFFFHNETKTNASPVRFLEDALPECHVDRVSVTDAAGG